jgi:hypothetical protein
LIVRPAAPFANSHPGPLGDLDLSLVSFRRWLVFGATLAVILAVAAPMSADQRGLSVLIILLAALVIGLIVEAARLVRDRPPRRVPTDLRPADGQVGLARMVGVVAEPHGLDPRFQRFVALDPNAPTPEVTITGGPAPLLGRVAIFSVFLGKNGRGWSDREIHWVHQALWRAGTWLEREAIRWNAPVNIELVDTDFVADDPWCEDVEIAFVPEGDHQAPFEARATTKALAALSRAAAQLGFADAADLIGQASRRVEADARVWLLHPRGAGRSLAVPEADTPWPGVSLAVCYAREASFPEPLSQPPFPDPVTIVHELLHLFGATDKYGVPLRAFPPRLVTPHDIMRLGSDALSHLRIDPATAAEIGWVAPPPPNARR